MLLDHFWGGTIRLGHFLSPTLEGYVLGGYQHGLPVRFSDPILEAQLRNDGDTSAVFSRYLTNVPILIGGRYFFLRPGVGPFGNAEVGLNLLTTHDVLSRTNARLGANIGVGWLFSNAVPIHVSTQFSLLNLLGAPPIEATILATNLLVGYDLRL